MALKRKLSETGATMAIVKRLCLDLESSPSEDRSEVWTGIILKEFSRPPQLENGSLESHFQNTLFEQVDIRMEPESKTVGNEGGLSFIDRIQQEFSSQRQEISSQRQEISSQRQLISSLQQELSAFQHHTYLIHASELEFVVPSAKASDRDERNALIHGANILFHVKVVRFMQQKYPSRQHTVSEGFTTCYQLSATEYGDKLDRAPHQVIGALNMRKELHYLHVWTRRKKTSKYRQMKIEMIGMCDTIIEAWTKSVSLSTAYPENDVTQTFNNLTAMYKTTLNDGEERG